MLPNQAQIMRFLLIPMEKHLLMLSLFHVGKHRWGVGGVLFPSPDVLSPFHSALCLASWGPSPPSFQMDWANGESIRRLKGGRKKKDWEGIIYSPGFFPVGTMDDFIPLKRKGTAPVRSPSALRSPSPDPSHCFPPLASWLSLGYYTHVLWVCYMALCL